MVSHMQAEAAIEILKRMIKAAENSNQAGEDAVAAAAAGPDLAWFTEQILNGIDTGLLYIDTPADETLENVLHRGRKALSKAQGQSPKLEDA